MRGLLQPQQGRGGECLQLQLQQRPLRSRAASLLAAGCHHPLPLPYPKQRSPPLHCRWAAGAAPSRRFRRSGRCRGSWLKGPHPHVPAPLPQPCLKGKQRPHPSIHLQRQGGRGWTTSEAHLRPPLLPQQRPLASSSTALQPQLRQQPALPPPLSRPQPSPPPPCPWVGVAAPSRPSRRSGRLGASLRSRGPGSRPPAPR